ncbi:MULTISPECIES: winged helix-turn-helix transcriptional regulator [Sphingomonadales]|uniref:Transcriptional regulator n=2 Tax=Edaphosphingomonas TaxID=3423724 RepID=A0A2T4I4D2_9SPHN|nr:MULTISPECIES: helix-turn-helix domain-containing protein [Sphingomonas]AGH50543.1 helix-turn-helix HxlR type protein [Sphingomonas sp. MM-1]MDX3883726.1 helix-turn-helix domain-containing protein [Sphingomonas sp.]OHT18973.1 putative HTH-type transcriptional regulator YybR [Sphingomonas haloaromaticamans]PTD24254.1 transcriptional regulator [Sphingomonas fennica]
MNRTASAIGHPASEPPPDIEHRDCRMISEILGRIGDKWTVLVVMTLRERPRRFNELKRAVDGISQQMLARTLKALERDGMVSRRVQDSVPPQVEYSLTELGTSLAEPVKQLGQWAWAHLELIRGHRAHYDRKTG